MPVRSTPMKSTPIRSTHMKSTSHNINSYQINFPWDQKLLIKCNRVCNDVFINYYSEVILWKLVLWEVDFVGADLMGVDLGRGSWSRERTPINHVRCTIDRWMHRTAALTDSWRRFNCVSLKAWPAFCADNISLSSNLRKPPVALRNHELAENFIVAFSVPFWNRTLDNFEPHPLLV